MTIAIKRKCDESMKRSKEKCMTPYRMKWRCNNDCKNCICGMYMTSDFNWHHNNLIGKQPKGIK